MIQEGGEGKGTSSRGPELGRALSWAAAKALQMTLPAASCVSLEATALTIS